MAGEEDAVIIKEGSNRVLSNVSLLLRQFILILGKNFLLQIRRPIGTLVEIILPILVIVFIIAIRFVVPAFQPADKCFVTFPSDPLTIPKYSSTEMEMIYFAPNNNTKAQQIALLMDKRINAEESVAMIVGVESQREFEVLIENGSQSLLESYGCFSKGAGIYFENLSGPDIKYSIHLRHDPAPDGSWFTTNRGPSTQPRGARISPNFYLNEGFMQLQKVIDESIVQFVTNESYNIDVTVRQFPYPKYTEDRFLQVADFILPLLVVLSLTYSAGIIVKELVAEKETRIRETMKMMGLSNWILASTWFIKQLLFYLMPVIIISIMLKYGMIFPRSDLLAILIFMLFFVISGIAFCFFISVWFSSAIVGLMAGIIAWLLSSLPFLVLSRVYGTLPFGVKVGSCLLSNTCVGFGVMVFSILELRQDGVTFSNFATPISLDDNFNMGWVILMFVIDTIIYMLLYWYIDAVKPGKYGVPRPFYFLFLPSFWCGRSSTIKLKPEEIQALSNSESDPTAYEDEPSNLNVGISIEKLTKIYNTSNVFRNKKRRKIAVDNLSLNMYKGQITALLGHNGAGKTTTMSILTGLFTATSGEAHINGYNITNEMDLIRRSLGICPQHNVLFDRLTVAEHLIFFSMLKGLPTKKVKVEVDSMLEDLKLTKLRSICSENLSGGLKRKLSVGIALVGGSEVVVLDEPTSGMDPYARRATWDLLVKHKEGRTMLLTTHFMDEADLLGDRIAIMAEGKLKCSGSSLFLKGRYGVGYHMTVVKNPGCDIPGVTELIQQVVVGSQLSTDVGAELSFILPSGSVKRFPPLFDYLDDHKAELGISSFGVSVTTMEEVFIKVGEGTDESFQTRLHQRQAATQEDTMFESTNSKVPNQLNEIEMEEETSKTVLNSGAILWFQQFGAMFLKKGLNSVRFWEALVWQLLLPILFIVFGLLFGKFLPGYNSNDPPRVITIDSSSESNNRTFFLAQSDNIDWLNYNYTADIQFDVNNLDKIGITDFFNITDSVTNIRDSVRTFSLATNCCGYKYQILDKFCATRGVNDFFQSDDPMSEACDGNTTFGYLPCVAECLGCADSRLHVLDSCTNPLDKNLANLITGGIIAENHCPQSPEVSYKDIQLGEELRGPLDDFNVYVAERLLQLSGDELTINDFFSIYQGGFVLQSLTPRYSMCGCDSPQSPDCNSLIPSLEENYNLTLFEEAYFEALNDSNSFAACLSAFTDTFTPFCNADWNYRYHWLIENCVPSSCPSCQFDPQNCKQFVGAVSQDYPPAAGFTPLSLTVWYNNQPYHMAPAVLNGFYNILLKQKNEFRNYTITVSNHPLPRSLDGEINDAQSEFLGFVISFLSLVGLSFMFAGFIITLVQEKESKAKHLQFVSGVSATSYWLSAFAFDLLNAFIPAIVALILFACFNLKAYQGESLLAIFLLLILCNWATIPVSYIFSFVFSTPLIGFAAMFMLYCCGALFHITVFLLNSSNKRDTAKTLHHIFLLHPTYALAIGLDDTYTNREIKDACQQSDVAEMLCAQGNITYADSPFDFEKPALGHIFIYLLVEGFLFITLTILLERSFFIPEVLRLLKFANCRRASRTGRMDLQEDDDVVAERQRVNELDHNQNEAVIVDNLTKTYRTIGSLILPCFSRCQTDNKLAVNQINLIVPSGECFGLLGVNGAGKTTMFKMLTGDITPSAGTAKLAGFDIKTQLRLVQQRIGYCPQFDAVLERLTGRELLTMFARLRGIPEKEIKKAVQKEINRLDLTKHANKRCGTYSGGNKRKLSTAVALVGNPPILLLDEPTTGMDPATRRFLWDALTGVIREGRSVILTSHSMEECEALCTRLAIMVNGQFKCLGSIQHLKSKFGSGYTLQVKVNPTVAFTASTLSQATSPTRHHTIDALDSFIKHKFPKSFLLEEHQESVTYRVSNIGTSWSSLFGSVEENKVDLGIVDYSISQTTLEQVFINFAKKQN